MKRSLHTTLSTVLWSALLLATTGCGAAQSTEQPSGRELLQKYAGSDDTDALLNEPPVRHALRRLLGDELPHLELNLNVRGSVDLISGTLSLSGNAPHQGTEEEAVVCISGYNLEVSAAIFSKGNVTVYSRVPQYDYLPLCIKDWITLVNSSHQDRMTAPGNVRMAPSR